MIITFIPGEDNANTTKHVSFATSMLYLVDENILHLSNIFNISDKDEIDYKVQIVVPRRKSQYFPASLIH